ncbi:uncharacterized protein [Coffea arabica]|uniref:Uncharacterized protein LOC113702140 isoform X1 n=1 Tax=Coffea arabica TaxID=13443 RepID=A0A6P6TKA2_COFAR|nr:uncharacterized protein LOC113702140 isoform X1 [Coffea arabica]XP_027078959.1 uncharacterized protein LOC113702140 isoform X1 [Coffea arabica]
MFVKKLVEKASFVKKPGGTDGLKPEDVDPRLIFHYGIPSGANLFAYNNTKKILAISVGDGRIKLFGKNGSQALLESPELLPSKFLQFIENQEILVNTNSNNHIEVWDLEKRCLSYIHDFKKEITSCTSMFHAPYMYFGDSAGNVSVFKVNQETTIIEQMKYHIPLSASHGNSGQVPADIAVIHILPQPTAESKRVLIIYTDGFMTLWDIQDSKAIFTAGGTTLQATSHETKKVTAATWACPFGSKVVVGYSNGEIFMWSIPAPLHSKVEQTKEKDPYAQNGPLIKLNLGYKLDKIPIAKLRWDHADGKASRLYVIGSSDYASANLLQVVLLNDTIESRTIKLGLHTHESPIDLEIVSSFNPQCKQKNNSLLLLGKSGHIYTYDDYLIERYLLQCQSKSSPSLPKEIKVKLPFADTSITVARFVQDNPHLLYLKDQDYDSLAKDILPLFPFETTQKDGTSSNSTQPRGLSKAKNLYITGHDNGAIRIWDVSCPLMRPILSVTQQSEEDTSLSGVPLTALYCTSDLQIFVSGDQGGLIRMYKFKPELFAPETSFLSLQGVSKKGSVIQSIKLLQVNGAVLFINSSQNAKYLAVGTDQGYVCLINLEGPTLLYERHFASELSTGIISLQSVTCSLHGFEKNVLVAATKDSSVVALETESGNTLNTNMIRPKKPSRALYMQILDGLEVSGRCPNTSERTETIKGNFDSLQSKQQVVVVCSEKAVYVYSLVHILQGIKKVHNKKKFHSSSCCWASILESPGSGLILLFSSGKIEIRSLPELSLLKETSVRGVRPSIPKQNSISNTLVCFSVNGDMILVEGDQEAFFISVSLQKDIYRFLDDASQVHSHDLTVVQESSHIIHKEKKKGLFGSVIKDIKGTKAKSETDVEVEDAKESIEALSTIFSVANFLEEVDSEEKSAGKDDTDLDIDDIDIEDPGEKQKGYGVMAALNKQNLADTFQTFKGRFKHMKVKTDKKSTNEVMQDEKGDSVDQIKKKYGYTSTGEPCVATVAKTKLTENLKKLQGIGLKSSEMQDTARSFSSMAKEVLRFTENDKRS